MTLFLAQFGGKYDASAKSRAANPGQQAYRRAGRSLAALGRDGGMIGRRGS